MKDFLGLIKASVFGNPTNPAISTSKKYQINKVDFSKVLVHTAILASITGVTYLSEYIKLVDFGQYDAIVILVANAVGQAVIKFLKDNDVVAEPTE